MKTYNFYFKATYTDMNTQNFIIAFKPTSLAFDKDVWIAGIINALLLNKREGLVKLEITGCREVDNEK